MAVYDLRSSRVIEQTGFDGLSLMSPTLARTVDGSVQYADAATDTAHSLRVYKGKMFILV
jgi:vacuolar protein sorting-associated protein 8